MSDLAFIKKFDLAMLDIYRRAKVEAKYNATVFFRMISERGGLATAKYLINAPKVSEGYIALYQRGHLNLTVEAVVFENPIWHELFTAEELKKCRDILTQYEYIPNPTEH